MSSETRLRAKKLSLFFIGCVTFGIIWFFFHHFLYGLECCSAVLMASYIMAAGYFPYKISMLPKDLSEDECSEYIDKVSLKVLPFMHLIILILNLLSDTPSHRMFCFATLLHPFVMINNKKFGRIITLQLFSILTFILMGYCTHNMDGTSKFWPFFKSESLFQRLFREGFTIAMILGILHSMNEMSIKKEDDLEKKKEELNELALRRTIFLSKISHEIRTPLNGILGFASLLQETKNLKQLEIIKNLSHDIKHIIDELIDYDKIKDGIVEMKYSCFDLHDLIKTAIKKSEPFNTRKLSIKCFIDPNVPQFVEGDRLKILGILLNIISNAIKYTEKGEITISCKMDPSQSMQDSDLCILFSIKDTGRGIKEEDMDKLFTPFLQLHDDLSRLPSTGLGLVICKHLVERMGGTINIESKYGEGTTVNFSIRLKGTCAPMKKRLENLKVNSDFAKKYPLKILVVEDNKINQMVIMRQLSKLGYNDVRLAKNGKDAIKVVHESKESFDLILMDVHMPMLNGLEATRQIRKMELPKQPIIYALTASSMKADKEACREAGMEGFISKPLTIMKLMKVIIKVKNHTKRGK